MARSKTPEPTASVRDVSFKTALEERYLAYALSTIMSRSLPDVRDGMKPVQRRLLYAMLQLKLDPKSGFKKCARVVGDVIGKYHPHGDSSVYDALVRLAQSFAVRYPLVDGQGNFGSIDGDNAAAMRYTEARLTEFAIALMEGLNENSIDFRLTYDGEDMEPIVLPAAVPNLLANGSEGIAVGMATSIPPHNVGEIADALLYLIQHPDCSVKQLVRYVKGPDFPTGGTLVEPRDNIVAAYETGRGSFRIRAVWKKEQLSHGLYQIVVTEIPYQVEKSKLIEKIADLFKEKKLPLLGNIRDESTEEMRLILEPKSRTVDPEMLMESLFKVSDLEKRFTLNMNVLSGAGVPQVMNLKQVLEAFLAHRHEVCLRRANYRLEKIADRLEVLEGFLIVYLNIDEVIAIIRKEDEPKPKMMKKWNLTDRQAEAILNMRLRSLRRLEEIEIKQEHSALSKEQKTLKAMLKSKDKQWEFIGNEIAQIKEQFGQKTPLGKRRTDFGEAPTADVISIEAFVEKEPVTVLLSQMGWIRAVKGHDDDAADALKYKEGDAPRFNLKAQTTDQLLVFATDGKCFTIACDKIPRGKGQGEPIRLLIDLAAEEDVVGVDVVQGADRQFLVASDIGKGFVVKESDVVAQTRAGRQVLNVPEGSKAVAFLPVHGDHVAVVGENRKLLVFPLSQVPVMKRGQGVALQKYKGSKLGDVQLFTLKEGITWRTGRGESTEKNVKEWLGNRAGVGKLPPAGFPRSGKFFS